MRKINRAWLRSLLAMKGWFVILGLLLLALLGTIILTYSSPIASAQIDPTDEPSGPSSDDLLKCLHDPIWPGGFGAASTVSISARLLDGDLQPVETAIQIWFQSEDSAPELLETACSGGECVSASMGPFESGTSIFYQCRVEISGDDLSTGWRQVNIGPPPADQVSPSPPPAELVRILVNSESPTLNLDQNVDILFIRDAAYPEADFLTGVHRIIDRAYYNESTFLFYQNRFNFWIATQPGNVVGIGLGGSQTLCAFFWTQDYTFADASAILHNQAAIEGIDCANRNFFRGFTGRPESELDVLHETGHMPFGLADEYFDLTGNDGYWQLEEFANLYTTQPACQAAIPGAGLEGVAGTCLEFDDAAGNLWYRLDPANTLDNDAMTGRGSHTAQPADQRRIEWFLDECSLTDCPDERIIFEPVE